MDRDEVEAALVALNVRVYVSQGRKLKGPSNEDLTEYWISALVAWAGGDESSDTAENDATAEMSLRGMPIPVARLGEVLNARTPGMDALRAQIIQRFTTGEHIELMNEFAELLEEAKRQH